MAVKTYTLYGYTTTLSKWARIAGLTPGTLAQRMKRGMSFEDAISTPLYRGNRGGHGKIEYNGESHTVREWSEIIGVSMQTIEKRLLNGMPLHKVFYAGDLRMKEDEKRPATVRSYRSVFGNRTVRVFWADRTNGDFIIRETSIKADLIGSFGLDHEILDVYPPKRN